MKQAHDKLDPASGITNDAELDVAEKIIRLTALLKKEQEVKRNFRLIVELMPVPIFIAEDKTDTIAYINTAFCEMFGYTQEDLLDKPASTFVPPELVEERETMRNARSQEWLDAEMGKARNHCVKILHQSGKVMNVPTIFYNWRTNGDRFITVIMLDRRTQFPTADHPNG